MFVLPGSANDRFEPLRIGAAHRVVNHHQTSAALVEFFQVASLLRRNRAGLRRIHHQHVCFFQLFAARETHGAVGFRAAFAEQSFPFRQETRVIMLSGAVRFFPATNKNTQGAFSAFEPKYQENGKDQRRCESSCLHNYLEERNAQRVQRFLREASPLPEAFPTGIALKRRVN